MDEENAKKETPLPPYAVGTKILLIDPDVTSLKHTTSMLEESTYQVTGIETPDVALSMMKEKTNEYDLIIAAANMPGIDCLTYLRSLMALTETPIVLISYVSDFQLIATALRQGISHFLEKPIKRDEARGLWQFVIRKPRKIIPKKTKNDDSKQNNVKGKGKEIMVQSHNKRKRIHDVKIDMSNYQNKGKRSIFISNGAGTSQSHLTWIPQLHEKFMKVLGDIPQATSGQATETLNTTVGVQAQLQSSDKETSNNQMGASPKGGMGVNATNINNNNVGNSGTIMSRPQTPNLLQNSNILGNVPNFVNQNNHVQIFTNAPTPCNNNNSNILLAGNNYGNSMTNGLSMSPMPQLINEQHVSFGGSSEKKSSLCAKIDEIRREYWSKEKAVIDAEDKLNEPVISDKELDMLLEPDLQNEDEQPTNAFDGTTIQGLWETNFDDVFLDDIFAELREDFGVI